ncbi:fibronectin type III domain-containing protein [Aquimarina sp. 2201CG1-2-11]|uniref:fibronectin type III domain-containing protein n=1 Tax=Aquimarina discodermiae TaxID=3231043 RepID=UPI003462C11D
MGALCISAFTYAQDGKNIISDSEAIFSKSLFTKAKGGDATLKINLIGEESSKLQINFSEGNANNNYRVLGDLNGATSVKDGSTVVIEKSNGKVSGRIVSFEEKKAYKIFTNEQGQIVSEKVDINHVACVNYGDQEEDHDHNHKGHDAHKRDTSNDTFSKAQPEYESLPGASHVIYLDFDGELVRNTSWNNGRDINAQPSGMSDQSILNVWKNMAEDFAAFKVNVTTKRSAYDAVPRNRRIMCIWTPTNTAAPGAGGVAWINGFSANNNEPCWAFIRNHDQSAGEVGSHEIGHTLGLRHDGKSGGTTYYAGHNGWAPIMGVSYRSNIGHWSKGEYNGANNREDDLAMISGSRNGFGYKTDDHGNTRNNATALNSDANGNVSGSNNKGLIERNTDKDVFSFSTSGGNVDFKFDPQPKYASLNIKARILNSNGQEVASSDPSGLKAAINTNLNRGTYYIEIDGVGSGANPSVGYSDYSSLGNFTISGKYPKEGDADTQAPTAPSRLAAANERQTTIDLTWEASTDNVGVTGYDVYRGNTMIATVAGTRYQATGLTAGTEYSFRVKAKDAAGNESGFSNTATASTLPEEDTQAPTAPSRLAASNETQMTIDLTWTASTDNVAVTGYDVYRGNTRIATVTGTRYQAAGLTPGTEYSFRVKAKDEAGNESGFSNTATASTLPEEDTQAPTAPSRLAAANETQITIDLSWEASTDNVAVTGYDVYQGDTMVATVPGTRYQAAGLTPGTEYSFRVKAKDEAGNESGFSNTATASTLPEDTTDTEAPTVPTELMASNETQTTIDLNWNASTDNVGVTGYEIYQGDTMVTTVAGTRYQVMGLTPGTEYSFRVVAMDAAGNKSGFSNTATASTLPDDTTDTEAPTEPTELMTSNETQTTIDLSWMAATDNVGVTGYEVYQGDTMIATVEGTRYQAMGLTPNTEYSFRVLAMDAAGNKSRFSNTATASTLPEDTADTEAPTAPTALAASNIQQTTLTLTWTASTDNVGVTGYNVYQGTEMIGTSATTSFNVSGLAVATTYQFTVLAMDAAGNMSEASNVATATTKDEDTTNICEGVSPWQWGVPYQTGDRVVYRGSLFEKLESGWKWIGKCGASSCEGIDDWKSGTKYATGDQVVYRGNLWQRTDRGWVFVSSCGAKSSSKIAPPGESIAIYPNPADNLINIKNYIPSEDQRATYGIFDILGRKVASGEYTSTTYDVSNLKAGTYIFKITTNEAAYTTSFVKQ